MIRKICYSRLLNHIAAKQAIRFSILILFTYSSIQTLSAQATIDCPKDFNNIPGYNRMNDYEKLEAALNKIANLINTEGGLCYAQEVLYYSKKVKDTAATIHAFRYIGYENIYSGNYNTALQFMFKALRLAENRKHTSPDTFRDIYQSIAHVYGAINDYKSSDLYMRKAANYMAKEIEPDAFLRQITPVYEKSDSLINAGNYNAASTLLHQAKPILNGLSDQYPERSVAIQGALSHYYNRIAVVFSNTNQLDSTTYYFHKAIACLTVNGDKYGSAILNQQLGLVFPIKQQADSSIFYLKIAYAIAKQNHYKKEIFETAQYLADIYAYKKNYKQALEYQKIAAQYKDSTHSANVIQQLANLRTDYEVSTKEKKIKLLAQENKLEKIYNYVAIICLLLTLTTALLFWQRWKNQQLQNITQKNARENEISTLINTQETKTLQAMVSGQENERKKLASKVQNELGNVLQNIKSNLENITTTAPSNYHMLNQLIEKATHNIRTLTHSLNMGISNEFGIVPALEESFYHIQNTHTITIEFVASIGTHSFGLNNEIMLYHIIQKLVSNTLKQAKASKIAVSLVYFETTNMLNIIVEDNGKYSKPINIGAKTTNNTLKNLQEIIAKLGGKFTIDQNDNRGTSMVIDLIIPTNSFTLQN